MDQEQWLKSECDAPLRNDGRSVHHRAMLEKEFARLERAISDCKLKIAKLVEPDPIAQVGGS